MKNKFTKDDYCTPEWLSNECKRVMGTILTDPWSNESAIKLNYIRSLPRLTGTPSRPLPVNEWVAPIFGNPPYSRGNIDRCIEQWIQGYFIWLGNQPNPNCFGCLLVNSETSSKWYQKIHRFMSAKCEFKGRISFIDPATMKAKNQNRSPSTLFYFGEFLDLFNTIFRKYGTILTQYKG